MDCHTHAEGEQEPTEGDNLLVASILAFRGALPGGLVILAGNEPCVLGRQSLNQILQACTGALDIMSCGVIVMGL